MLGYSPREILQLTVPEIMLALRGWQRARGIDPDSLENSQPMTKARLMELISKELQL